MKDVEFNGFICSTNKAKIDLDVVHDYLCNESYWAKGIPIEVVKNSVENSLCFGIYQGSEQVGFARVITDFSTFAYLCDLFVLAKFQGKGLSKFLMKCILSHSNLKGLRRFLLATRDAHGLYKQVGFTPIARPEFWMEINDSEVYSKNEKRF
ncbi:Acetyltransferase (GNAT) domain-containing protein [Spirosomataceae bacterium TFI 002]|nr:Acetyltransferase (GNAT) domain-containing protein [Spirosomataceae bacterium TFI 002]